MSNSKTEQYFFHLLVCGITNKTPMPPDEEIDFAKIYAIALGHRIGNIIYYALKKLDVPTQNKILQFQDLRKNTILYGLKQKKQDDYFEEIVCLFKKNDINLTIFKGQVLKYYYPTKDMRVMGDIDIIVSKKDINKAYHLLLELGYLVKKDYDFEVVFVKDTIYIELHRDILHDNIDLFENIDDKIILFLNYENVYQLKPEYSFIYNISHIFYHLNFHGFGIKYILDLFFLIQDPNLNLDMTFQMLKEYNLDKFVGYLIKICEKWLGLDSANYQKYLSNLTIKDDLIHIFAQHIISSGEYGIHYDVYSVKAAQTNKLLFVIKKIFPAPHIVLNDRNPKLYKYFLLPIFYIIYYIKRLFNPKTYSKSKRFLKNENHSAGMKKIFNELNIKN